MIKKTLLFLSLTLFSSITFALQQDYAFKHINVEDGLSQSWVRTITQDSLGFIWIGTSDGLNKYDGYSFTIFKNDPSNTQSLLNNHIQALVHDDKGQLWIGTVAGLCFFDSHQNKFHTPENIIKTSITALLYHNKQLFIGSSKGLYIYNTEKDSLLSGLNNTLNQQFRSLTIYSLKYDNKGNIWIGTNEGLYTYNVKSRALNNIATNLKQELAQRRITAIEFDTHDNTWIGTEENGLYLIPAETNSNINVNFSHFEHDENNAASITGGSIFALTEDKHNNLWIGSENGGLDVITLNSFDPNISNFRHNLFDPSYATTISNNSIYSIFEDSRGDLWIGTYGDGINFLNSDGENFKLLQHIPKEPNSLINNFVNAIQRIDNHLWIGTEGGISILNMQNNQYKHLVHTPHNKQSLSVNAIMSIFEDRQKNIWVSTWAGGLNKREYGKQNFIHYRNNPNDSTSIQSDNIFRMNQDEDGNMWFAVMDGGLNYMLAGENYFRHFKIQDNRLPSSWIRDICISDKEHLWFSTDNSVGYYNITHDTFHNFYPNKKDTTAFNGNGAYVIFRDSKGNIWFGSDAGLNYYHQSTNSFRSYMVEDGLPNNSVKSILEDNNGNLWLGTNKGISKFLNAIQKPHKAVFINYDTHDGLQGNEFNRRAAYKDDKGYMYFGGSNGVSYFHPDSIRMNTFEPRLALTNFEIYNKPVKIGSEGSPLQKHITHTKHLILVHKHAVFTIQFAALSYVGKEKNQYSYKLEGFEDTWNDAGSVREATYTNLDAGDYIFKVKAANNDGLWTPRPLELSIKVLPPWWKSKYALLGYLLGLLLSAYGFILISMSRLKNKQLIQLERKQRKQEEDLNQKKLQFFTNISHEFRTPLTLIYSPLEDILRNKHDGLPAHLEQKFSIIYKNALRLNRLIGELMDFRKIQFDKLTPAVFNQDLNSFVSNTVQLFSLEAIDNGISLSILNPETSTKAWFDPIMIEKVLFNLISNAFKVTKENGKIEISVYETSDQPQITSSPQGKWKCVSVKDTGPGLETEEIAKIFDRFYQVDAHTKSYYSSTGIGLSLARNMMELHNGYITVKSEPEKGAEFIIWLREGKDHFKTEQLKDGKFQFKEQTINIKQEPQSNSSTINDELQKYTVLVVEDNAELRKYLKSELSRSFKVWVAKDGQEGLDMALKYYPDIIVSDIIMPQKDGYQLCAEVKENIKLSHIPVILLTAKGAVDDQLKGLNIGADDYIVKPFNTKLLKAKIKQLINSQKQLIKKYSDNINLISEDQSIASPDRHFLKEVNTYIIQNMDDSELSVEKIGEKMAISRSQLYRKIKAFSGVSVNEYIRNIRLEAARKHLISKKYSINEVVYKVGFTSPSYFSKCYKEHFGKLPSEE